MKRLAIALLLFGALAAPLAAHAQDAPAPTTSQHDAPGADPADAALERRIQGALAHAFPGVRVDASVRFGIATLEGKVSSTEDASIQDVRPEEEAIERQIRDEDEDEKNIL